jgi:hypothetical protein
MFFKFDPERGVAQLKAEFEEGKAQIWADPDMPLEDKGPAVEELWRDFDRQRKELRDAFPEEADVQGHPSSQRSRAAFFPRRRKPQWK